MNLRPRGAGASGLRGGGDDSPEVIESQARKKAAQFFVRNVCSRPLHPVIGIAAACLLIVSIFSWYTLTSDISLQVTSVGVSSKRLRGRRAHGEHHGRAILENAGARPLEVPVLAEVVAARSAQEAAVARNAQQAAFVQPAAVPSPRGVASPVEPVPVAGRDLVRGAGADVQPRYAEQRKSGHFRCFDGSATFSSFDVVNDDYCDCADGSDEPGTSACVGIVATKLPGFSCSWAGAKDESHSRRAVVRLGAVNDGVCDCCGGDDEWDHANGAALCLDRCAAEDAEEKAEASAREAGSRARLAYVTKAASLRQQPRNQHGDFGPDSVYLAVKAEGCLTFKEADYTYEVCVFDHITQRDRRGSTVTIGKGGEWATTLWENGEQRKDYSKLIMGGGTHCWASQAPRRAEVEFECAAKPSIVSIKETQVCVYGVHFRTPAACEPRS